MASSLRYMLNGFGFKQLIEVVSRNIYYTPINTFILYYYIQYIYKRIYEMSFTSYRTRRGDLLCHTIRLGSYVVYTNDDDIYINSTNTIYIYRYEFYRYLYVTIVSRWIFYNIVVKVVLLPLFLLFNTMETQRLKRSFIDDNPSRYCLMFLQWVYSTDVENILRLR